MFPAAKEALWSLSPYRKRSHRSSRSGSSPRATIRNIVDTNPKKYVIVLAMLAGIGQTLNREYSLTLGDSLPLVSILLLGILLGPLVGIITLYLGGALFRWTGSRLGGKATAPEVRAAIAWSSVPTIVATLLYIPELAVFGEELFTSELTMTTNPALMVALLGFGIIEIFVTIWALVIFLKCLAEVHRFSAWRAAGAALFGALIVGLPIAILLSEFTAL